MAQNEGTELRGAVPPSSVEAEISVLGAMMLDPNAVEKATETLRAEDFFLAEHQEIYSAMAALHDLRRPVDLTTVEAELRRRGSLEGIGGVISLMKLQTAVPATANVGSYIQIVHEKSLLRRLIRVCGDISRACYTQQNPLEEIFADAEKAIFDLTMNRGEGESLKSAREVLMNTYAQIEELSRMKGNISGVPTGFLDLDGYLTGLHGGEFVVIGARPAMGKSSFAMNIATHASVVKNKTVAIFSLEMPREQIMMRVLCSEAKVDMQRVRKGLLADEDWLKLARALGPISNAPLYLDDTAGLTPSQLRSRCRRLKAEKGRLDLVIVDYIGLMHSDGRVENRQLEVAEISRQMKALALEMNIPVVGCAQLSRANKERIDKRPMLSDLRDSGSIEQDADVVMFLHREEYYNRDTEDKNIAEIIIAKQRSGPLGMVKLAWLSEYTTFANLAKDTGGGDAPF